MLVSSRHDRRIWKLEFSRAFSCKSYQKENKNEKTTGQSFSFQPLCAIWKAKVPPKVRVLGWIIAQGRMKHL